MIESHEIRHVAYIDIPGDFLHELTNEKEIMILEGPLAELMVVVDLKLYRKFVTYYGKGVALFYVKIKKELYGLLMSALLFYNKLVEDLESMDLRLTLMIHVLQIT